MQLSPGSMAIGNKILQNAAVAIGEGNSISCYDSAKGAFNYVLAQVTAIGTATITWQGTLDGTNWASIQAEPLATGTKAATATAAGLYLLRVTGLTACRANITAWTSDPVTVLARSVSQ